MTKLNPFAYVGIAIGVASLAVISLMIYRCRKGYCPWNKPKEGEGGGEQPVEEGK
jgi:hypothetical protein